MTDIRDQQTGRSMESIGESVICTMSRTPFVTTFHHGAEVFKSERSVVTSRRRTERVRFSRNTTIDKQSNEITRQSKNKMQQTIASSIQGFKLQLAYKSRAFTR